MCVNKTIWEPAREIPVLKETDVLVAGGGSAGVTAAVAAARRGMKVLLAEQFGSLGGSGTNSLVTPLMGTGVPGNPPVGSISMEIDRLSSQMGAGGWNYDPEGMKLVFQRMAVNAGVEILYYTKVSGVIAEKGVLKGVIVENKEGRSAILAKCVIDCTGDADVCVRAGVPYESGDPEEGKNQAVSLRYMVAGVDEEKFAHFFRTFKPDAKPYEKGDTIGTAFIWRTEERWPLAPVIRKAYEAGDLEYTDGLYWQMGSIPGHPGYVAFNNPGIYERNNGAKTDDLTHAQLLGREIIYRQMQFYRKYLPGFENAYLVQAAPMVGVRESRRVKGRYVLTAEDVFHYRKFEDGIVKNNYPIDVHSTRMGAEPELYIEDIPEKEKYHEIPFGCLVAEGIENLMVAGRCASFDFLAQSSTRIIPICRAMGEAAGIGAAMAVTQNIFPSQVDGKEVRLEMERSIAAKEHAHE